MVALPLSVGRMERLVLFFKVFSVSLSALVKLSLGLEKLFIILTVSCLAYSAISTDRDSTALSTSASIGIVHGVTA